MTVAIECIILLAFYLYNHKGCNKLVVDFLSDNQHIQRITEKGGFTRECLLTKESILGDQYVDEVRYTIFKDKAYELYGSYYESLLELPGNRDT
jgi:RimJ/RimL family protein N-acetyltransferase